MHAVYAIVFVLLAAVCGVCAWVSADGGVPGLFVAPAWTSVVFLSLSTAYAGLGPGVFGKRATGRQALPNRVLFFPYLLLNAVVWRLHRLLSRERAFAEVVPNLFFGRRLTAAEARAAVSAVRWAACLDLAPEFTEAPALRALPRYRSLPVLDATAPSVSQLCEAVRWLRESVAAGPTYVHCALGHGRTGTVVVAYLLATAEVSSVSDAVRRLRAHRPGVRLNRSQVSALRTFANSHRA